MLQSDRLDDLFHLLQQMTRSRRGRDISASPTLLERLERWFGAGFIVSIIAFVALLAIWYLSGKTNVIQNISIYSYLAGVASASAYTITLLVGSIMQLSHERKKPFAAMFSILQRDLHGDEEFLRQLWRFDKATLVYGLTQYRHSWSSFDGRIALMTGDLRRVGLFPAWAAVTMSGVVLYKGDASSVLWIPLILAACFYFISFICLAGRERSQQVVELVEYAIEHMPVAVKANDQPIQERTAGVPVTPVPSIAPS